MMAFRHNLRVCVCVRVRVPVWGGCMRQVSHRLADGWTGADHAAERAAITVSVVNVPISKRRSMCESYSFVEIIVPLLLTTLHLFAITLCMFLYVSHLCLHVFMSSCILS